MQARKTAALFLALVAALAAGAFTIHALTSNRGTRGGAAVALDGAGATADDARDAAIETEPVALADEPLVPEEPSARASATDERAAAPARDESFPLEGARSLAVTVVVPGGTPADEEATVWVLALLVPREECGLDYALREVENGEADPLSLLAPLAEAPDTAADQGVAFARRDFDAAGGCELPYPPQAKELHVLLTARYLYLDAPVAVDPAAAPAHLTLEPRLGACIAGRAVVPADAHRREVDPARLAGRIHVYGTQPIRRGGDMSVLQREAEIGEGGEFEVRALPAGVSLAFAASIENLLPERRMETLRLDAGETRALTVRFRLGASIRGQVLAPDGTGIAGAHVSVSAENNGFGPFWRGVDGRATDEQGRFALHGLGEGELEVNAQADGWTRGSSGPLTLTADQEITGLRIVMDRGAGIDGTVSMPDGTPAAGADVSLERWNEQGGHRWTDTVASAVTGDDGRFAITGLADGGSYDLRVSKAPSTGAGESRTPGWFAERTQVASGTSGLAITLVPTTVLSGVVLDDAGEPVTSFQVSANPADESTPWSFGQGALHDAFEDPEGRFALAGLHAGRWRVVASAEGYHLQGEAPTIEVPQTVPSIELRLARSGSVRGRVVDPLGAPVAGAVVALAQADGSRRVMFSRSWSSDDGVETDAEGAFLLAGLAPGSVAIEARAEGWAISAPLQVDLPAGDVVEGVVIQLRNGGRIVGDAFDESGDPLAGRNVTLGMQFFDMGDASGGGVTTDAAGHFVFEHVDPGRYAVTLAPPMEDMITAMSGEADESTMIDWMSKIVTETVTVVEGQEVYVRLGAEPKRPVQVRGKVTEAGAPVPSGMVFGISEGGSVLQGMKMAQIKGGAYEFTLDRPGAYVFGVQSDFSNTPLEFQVDVPEAEAFEHDLALPLGAIAGTVYGADGEPAANVPVRAEREDGGFSFSKMDGSERTTDERGSYVLDHLRAGNYTVRAGGGQRFTIPGSSLTGIEVAPGVVVEEDEITDGVDFRLRESGRIEGVVVDGAGEPVGGVAVFARNERGALLASVSRSISEPNGRFRCEGLAPGRYTLSARGDGVAAADGAGVDVVAGEASEVELAVDAATMLLVTVEDESGETIRATIQVFDERGHEVGSMQSEAALESLMMEGIDSKRASVGPLPPGKYEVRATAKDGRWSSKPVSLSGKDERSLRIRIRD